MKELFADRRPEQTFRPRLLPARPRSAVSLRRQHGRRRALPLQERRPQGHRPGGKTARPHRRRRGAHHPRARVLAGRQEALRHGRQRFQRRRGQQTRRTRARAGLGNEPGRHRPEDFRLRHPQPGGHRHPPRHGRGVGQHQRTRRPGRRPRAGLRHPRHARRFLRLAVVLHGQPPGPAQGRHASRTRRQSAQARRAGAKPFGVAQPDVLHRQPVPGGIQRAMRSRRSTAVGTAPSAPATRSCACPSTRKPAKRGATTRIS